MIGIFSCLISRTIHSPFLSITLSYRKQKNAFTNIIHPLKKVRKFFKSGLPYKIKHCPKNFTSFIAFSYLIVISSFSILLLLLINIYVRNIKITFSNYLHFIATISALLCSFVLV